MANLTTTTRRSALLGALGAAAAALPAVAGVLPPLPNFAAPGATQASPDAALIRACTAYPALLDAVNSSADGDIEDGSAQRAYDACASVIARAEPQSMAGVVAMAGAIKAEARGLNGGEQLHGTMGEDWALIVVNALLRLNGGAA